jgi:hypothetical protein
MRKVSLLATVACLLLCLVLSVSAQASTASGNAQAYGLFHTYFERLDGISSRTMKDSLSRTEARLGPCFSKLLGDYYKAGNATGTAPSQGTLRSLSEELGVELVFKGGSPLVSAELNVRPFLGLHLPTKYHKAFVDLLEVAAEVRNIDFCADAKAWEASSLATSWALPAASERALLQLSETANSKLADPGKIEDVQGFTPVQKHAVHILADKAGKHVKELLRSLTLRLGLWLDAVIVKVQSQYPTTTTTTTTPTSTTPTG